MNIDFTWSQNLPHVDDVVSLAQVIIPDNVLKSLRRMKNGKAARPSGVVAEMLKAAPGICSKNIADLVNAVVCKGKVFVDWSGNIVAGLFKEKGGALDWKKYHRLKLNDHVQKVIERVVKNIRETVNCDEMQLGFCPTQSTTDAIFNRRQLQEKYLVKHRKLYIAFVDLEKAFIECPERYCGGLFVLLIYLEWLVKVVQSMYVGAGSRTRVKSSFSDKFEIKVGVHY